MSDLYDRAPAEPMEPVPVHKCNVCDEYVYEGEAYYEDGNNVICNNDVCLAIYCKWTVVTLRTAVRVR